MRTIIAALLLLIGAFPVAAEYAPSRDPDIRQAIRIIKADYGDDVSLEAKDKNLLKFGRNRDVEQDRATIMTLPDGVDNETYLSSNDIAYVVSTSTNDGEQVVIEGHTISGSDFTFVTQTATLNGQTSVTLSTALARVTRLYNNDSTELEGTIYVCEDDTLVGGVPQTDSKVHLMLFAGTQQSQKAATALSSVDYWIITGFEADMLTRSSAFAEIDLEVRLSGKVFRSVAEIGISDSSAGRIQFKPYIIVPPNSDIRLTAVSDSATGRDISGFIQGYLAKAQ